MEVLERQVAPVTDLVELFDRGPADHAIAQGLGQRDIVYHGTSRGVDQQRIRFHGGQRGRVDQVVGIVEQRYVQGDDVRLA